MKACRVEPAVVACNALISALEKCSCWQRALSSLISVGINADIVTFNAALGACAKAQAWPFALELFGDMSASKLQPDAVSYNVVIGACERSSQWEAVLALLREESSTFGKLVADLCTPNSGTFITRLLDLESKSNSDLCHLVWRFAKLAQAALFDVDIRCITRAATTVLTVAVNRDLHLSEISTYLWSLAVLGVNGPGVRRLMLQLRKRLAAGQEKLLPLSLLANIIWAVAMMKDLELLVLQKEMVARSKMDFWQTLDFASAALEVLWASAFVQRLPVQVENSLSESVRRIAGELDRRPSPALSSPATSSGPQKDRESESPRILRCYSDRVVVYKPPGWQVDDALAERRLPLSSWLHRALAGQQNLLEDLQHRRGFIHRLDVPTSGLLLVATSYAAYYDMQLQLMARRMTRQYLVLCHGWLGARTKIEARIHSLEDGPSWYRSSRISSVGGRPSATLLEPVAYATMDEKAFTLTDFQIVTGRRHQIRVHTAHCGYPTMSDARYTAEATFKDDSSRCPRNFLHRYRLKFEVADMAAQMRYQEVEEQLPQDLANILDLLVPVSAASAQGIRRSRP
ncbi:rluD [Symbiodinium sp. CCMP2456]|nr:rluD [Symbiodinium sp. CCMP2456]